MKKLCISQTVVISIIQFGVAFSLSSIIVSLPFYVHNISTYSPAITLLWVGTILSSSNIGAAIFSPIWGRFSSRFSHKTLYQRGILSHAILLFIMGYTQSLPMLLVLRSLQGVMGGISTIGLIILKEILPEDMLSSAIGKFQSSITTGQLCGPAIGAFMAYAYGFKASFVFASVVIFLIFLLGGLFLEDTYGKVEVQPDEKRKKGSFFSLWLLSLSATVQAVFFPAILPEVLNHFHVDSQTAIMSGGIIVFAYGVSSALGAYFLPSLFSKKNVYSIILLLGILSSFFQLIHISADSINILLVMRMVQTFFAAAIMPLCITIIASKGSGTSIGMINTARFAGNACGPVIATLILSYADEKAVYMAITALTLFPLYLLQRIKPS